MQQYLTFQLYGPFAAFGTVAVGEVRPISLSPAKSTVLGLLAGALGVDRYDNNMHRNMADSYGLAVRMDVPGKILRDFHTIQSCTPVKGFSPQMRREELGPGTRVQTIISRRDYLTDSLCMVCIKPLKEPPFSLTQLKNALEYPVYVPYIGRKSCPAGLPFAPSIEHGESFREVLQKRSPNRSFLNNIVPEKDEKEEVRVRLFWDEEEGMNADHTLPRRDVPLNRKTWQFGERLEMQGDMELP